jgi:hypothetical protein
VQPGGQGSFFKRLLSLTYRLAIRNGKVKGNPGRLVPPRLEDNARIRFLSADEETALRKPIEGECSERMPEFDLAQKASRLFTYDIFKFSLTLRSNFSNAE